jgi:hypothetical protein
MNAKLEFNVFKSVLGSSVQGITLHWMKAIYGKDIEDAITNAVQLIYYPRVLAASFETLCEVGLEVTRSRLIFQERMGLAKGAPSSENPLPKRVEFSFNQSLERDSRKGKTFAWLVETYGNKTVDAVLEALCLIYFPAALAASPATSSRAQREANCSRLIFEEKMTGALLQNTPSGVPLSLYRQGDISETSYLSDCNNLFPPLVVIDPSNPLEKTTEATAPEAIADDDEEDYEPPDYGLDFGNNVGN